jgi:hypothetical protein
MATWPNWKIFLGAPLTVSPGFVSEQISEHRVLRDVHGNFGATSHGECRRHDMDGTPDLAGGQCLATAHRECQARASLSNLWKPWNPWVLNRANRNCYGLGWFYPQTALTSPCTTGRDENGSNTDGYHCYRICFHIYVRIRIRIRIVSKIPDKIRLDIDIINM